MGLASAMSTALTGMGASETTIDVVGNNLANSNTIGFKASQATFATQFLQTQSLGTSPTSNNGGTNPQQEGLGTMVSEIAPNFSQGTIETTTSSTDMAIQGDGFFIVQGGSGEQLFTRNGQFTTNGKNELVTSTGNRLLGYGINNQFEIDTSQLQPLQIPLGSAMVAKATTTAQLQGALTPSGTLADTATILKTGVLTDGSKTFPQNGPTASLDGTGNLSGSYQYYVTFANGNEESRPQLLPVTSPPLNNNQVELSNIPTDTTGEWTTTRIYRSVNDASGGSKFYEIAELPSTTDTTATVVDNYSDQDVENGTMLTPPGSHVLSMYGPPATAATKLSDVVNWDGTTYQQTFPALGALQFTGSKGGSTLTAKTFQVTDTSTLQDLATFMGQALGIQGSPGLDPANPVPSDGPTGLPPGGTITSDGCLELVGNNGTANAIGVGLSGLQMTTNDVPPQQLSVSLPFNTVQQAAGQSTSTDMVVYDSLGIPLSVHLTAVLQQETGTATTYRWFADCGQNDPGPGSANTSVGTGLITFDGQGNFISASNSTISIDRYNEPSNKPLQVNLNFSQVSGLASSSASLSVSQQDGSAPGTLTSFQIGGDGLITGVFSNGISRDLGQIRLARFSNPTGLEQQGQNLYATGVNSGLPIENDPGTQGTGSIVAGSLELSNTDIGSSLIDLITASTMYSSNTRVITTAQQMFDSLLSLMR